MQAWEYQWFVHPRFPASGQPTEQPDWEEFQRQLNADGRDGWEVCGIWQRGEHTHVLLKRPSDPNRSLGGGEGD